MNLRLALRNKRMLAVGHVTLDRYGSQLLAGGSAYYAARAWQGLGAQPRLYTSYGDDFDAAHVANLHCVRAAAGPTTIFTNIYERSSTSRWVEAIGPILRPPESAGTPSDALLLAPVMGEVVLEDWIDGYAGVVGACLQGFVRATGTSELARPSRRAVVPRRVQWPPGALGGVDVMFASDEDIEAAGGEGFLEELRREVEVVVMTLGARGSRIWTAGRCLEASALRVGAQDPTGAGDVFSAAFLLARVGGASLEDCTRLATAAASVVVEGIGSQSMGRLDEAFTRMRAVTLHWI